MLRSRNLADRTTFSKLGGALPTWRGDACVFDGYVDLEGQHQERQLSCFPADVGHNV